MKVKNKKVKQKTGQKTAQKIKQETKQKVVKKTVQKKVQKIKKPVNKKKIIAKKSPNKKLKKKDLTKKKLVKKTKKAAKVLNIKNIKKDKKVTKTAKTKEKITKNIVQKEIVKNNKNDNLIDLREKFAEKKHNFKINDVVIYPSHGIGRIIDIETTMVVGQDFSCFLLYFEKERLTIKVPMKNAHKIGIRHLVSKEQMDEVFAILRSGVKKMKGMWSRRAQEYESKINSGDIVALAEVLRDLARDIEDGQRSYSERIIYETATARLAAEYGAVYKISYEEAREIVIATAKDKLGIDEKLDRKPKDDFDFDQEKSIEDGDEELIEDEEEEEEEDDFEDDFEDDEKPRKKHK